MKNRPVYVRGFAIVSATKGSKTVPVGIADAVDVLNRNQEIERLVKAFAAKYADARFDIDEIPEGYYIVH